MRLLVIFIFVGLAAALPKPYDTAGEHAEEVSIDHMLSLLGDGASDSSSSQSSHSSSSQLTKVETSESSYFVSLGGDSITEITVAEAEEYGLTCLPAGALSESADIIVEESVDASAAAASSASGGAAASSAAAGGAAASSSGAASGDSAASSAASGGSAASSAASEDAASSSAASGDSAASSAASGGSAASSAASEDAASSSAASGDSAASSAASGGSAASSAASEDAASSAAASGDSAASSAASGGSAASSAASEDAASSSAASGDSAASSAASGGSAASSAASEDAASSSAASGDSAASSAASGGSAASSAASEDAASSSAASGDSAASSAASGGSAASSAASEDAASSSAASGDSASSSAASGESAAASAASGDAASSSAASGDAASSSAASGDAAASSAASGGSAASSAASEDAASSSAASGDSASSSAASGESAAASAASGDAASSSAASSDAASSSAASGDAAASSAASGDAASSSAASGDAASSSAASGESAAASAASGDAASSSAASGDAASSASSAGESSSSAAKITTDGYEEHYSEEVEPVGKCVPYYLCKEGDIITDGAGLIDIRFLSEGGEEEESKSNSHCTNFLEVMCGAPLSEPDPEMMQELVNYEYVPSCGHRNPRGVGIILDGFQEGESQFAEYPWMGIVLQDELIDYDQVIQRYVCGASLIHPQVVMTGAHCVSGKDASKLVVRLGDWDTQNEKEIFPHEQHRVASMAVHERFNKANLRYDVALLFLEEPVELKEHIDTLCLPEEDEDFDYSSCVATGFGKDQFHGGRFQNIMKQVDLSVVPHKTCQKKLQSTRLGRWFRLHRTFTCAGGEGGVDTCRGDGGSPLACPSKEDPNKYVQAGIVAWGIGCGEDGVPGVYASVPKLVKWVNEKIDRHFVNIDASEPQVAHAYGARPPV